jgi:photosystem II stability/assembly factor-like uncharacterized protein
MNRPFELARIVSRCLAVATPLIFMVANPAVLGADPSNRPSSEVAVFAYDGGTGELLKANAHTLYRSGNEGQSWEPIPLPPAANGPIAAVATPANSKGVLYVAGPGLGVWRTSDDGKNWVDRTEGLPSREVAALTAHATQSQTLYAFVPEQGIYRSQDAGSSWRLMDRGPKEGLRQLIHSNMAGSMQTGWVFAATSHGVRRIMDCFCLWQDAGRLGQATQIVTFEPGQPERIYSASENALFRSIDGGENWATASLPSSSLAGLAFARSGVLYAMSTEGVLFRSVDQGTSWTRVNE